MADKVKHLQKLIKNSSDPFVVGDILTWSISYADGHADEYTYAAIKAGNNKWYVTGSYGRQGVELQDLVNDYFTKSGATVNWLQMVTEFKDVEI